MQHIRLFLTLLALSFCFTQLSCSQVMPSNRSVHFEDAAPELQRIPTLPNIRARMVQTPRLRTRVLFSGNETGIPVIFIHGNLSSATWWEETMLRLPASYYAIAPDLRGFGAADSSAFVDARRGVGDWVDDILALADALNIQRFHVVGNSLGGNVVWGLLLRCPERLISATLVAPGSPFGFGGTKDTLGTPCFPDYAGSGAGLANSFLLNSIKAGDRGLSAFSPRTALRNFVFKPGFIASREEDLLTAMMSVQPMDSCLALLLCDMFQLMISSRAFILQVASVRAHVRLCRATPASPLVQQILLRLLFFSTVVPWADLLPSI